jgi:hypothetical protein
MCVGEVGHAPLALSIGTTITKDKEAMDVLQMLRETAAWEFLTSTSGSTGARQGLSSGVIVAALGALAVVLGVQTRANADVFCYGIAEGTSGWVETCESNCPTYGAPHYWKYQYYNYHNAECSLTGAGCHDNC